MSPARPTPSHFPGWPTATNAPVARGGDASPSAVGPLAPTGDRDTGQPATEAADVIVATGS